MCFFCIVCPSHLAAMKAPKIIVNTVILIDVEKVFLQRGIKKWNVSYQHGSFPGVNTFTLNAAEEMKSWTYLSKIPSNTMVSKILNLLKTVNMGKLGEEKTLLNFAASY